MSGLTAPSRIRCCILTAVAGALSFSAPAFAQDPTFRIRSDLSAPLNADAGWAAGTGETTDVFADQPFRLRLESLTGGADGPLTLQVRRNNADWVTLEAHDFPYPERDLTLSYEDALPGAAQAGWVVLTGGDDALRIVEQSAERFLRLSGGADGLTAVSPAPWGPSADVTIAARLRLADVSDSLDFLFGVEDAAPAQLVRLSADGAVQVIEVQDGSERVTEQVRADISAGAWLDIEVALEGGLLEIEVDGVGVHSQSIQPRIGEPGLALPAGGSADLAEISVEGVARAPQASIVASSVYTHGEATADLLSGADASFVAGIGISLRERAPGETGVGGHREHEWPLVIRRYADGPTVSENGDTFAFRMVDATGAAVSAEARVVLTVPPGHLGGTFVETPGRIGPWRASNGDLYFIMEPSETDNKFMMMKSVDGGASWREVDGANRPETGDLEAVDARLVGDRIHIVHQVTRSVRHHVFRTSDHATDPDSWEVRDSVAAEARAIAQMATMVARDDGSLVTVYLADRLNYAIRSPDGVWSAPVELDPGLEVVNVGPQAALASDGEVHLAYFTDDGRIWHRVMSADGAWSARRLIAEGAGEGRPVYGAVLPLAYHPRSDTLTIAYRLADGHVWERALRGDTLSDPVRVTPVPVVTNAVDSQQAGADLLIADDRLVVLFIDEETRSLFSTDKVGGAWSEPALRAGGIDAAWVRGAVVSRTASGPVIGYVYDAGSQGGTGLNRYATFPLPGGGETPARAAHAPMD